MVTFAWLESIFEGVEVIVHCFIVGIGKPQKILKNIGKSSDDCLLGVYFAFKLIYKRENGFQIQKGLTDFTLLSAVLCKAFLDVLGCMKALAKATGNFLRKISSKSFSEAIFR